MAGLSIGITPWRYDARADASVLVRQATRAEALGFHSFWLPESHFAGPGSNPAPLLLLAVVAAHTERLRVATTSYLLPVRHPLQAAEEVAVLDRLSNGRLILGVGRGFRPALFTAYDLPVREKRDRFEAALAVMRDAWEGRPVATAAEGGGVILSPLPVQQPHPPIWVAARDAGTFNAAVKEGYHVMTWALTRPFSEVEAYMERFEAALAANPGTARPRFMTMRHTGIYETSGEADAFIQAIQHQGRQFENLFRNLAPVVNGFPEEPDPAKLVNQAEYEPGNLLENLVLGTPEEAIAKLKAYEALGVDYFCYNAAYGLPMELQKKSLRLFIDEVLPAFQEGPAVAAAE